MPHRTKQIDTGSIHYIHTPSLSMGPNPRSADFDQPFDFSDSQRLQAARLNSMASSSSSDHIGRPSLLSESSKSSASSTEDGQFVRLARRRATKSTKERASQRKSAFARPQGRPLSKETRVRLTLVPTMGILYSILVSDTMRKQLKVVRYSSEPSSSTTTNEEMSTKNVLSGFSSLLNVQSARFSDDPSASPDKESPIPQFQTIDEAVYRLFGLSEYSLLRVTRAAATEVGGSVLLKIETAMPGYLFLNDDEEDDFTEVQMNKELYQESIGNLGDRPSTTFLKKRVARPRYKSDMRIYLIPKSINCAIYCEKRIFKRDLVRGFLDFKKGDRSIIIAFDYGEALQELELEGHRDLFATFGVPTVEEVEDLQKLVSQVPSPSIPETVPTSIAQAVYGYSGSNHNSSAAVVPSATFPTRQPASVFGTPLRQPDPNPSGMSIYEQNATYMGHPQAYPINQGPSAAPFGYTTLGYGGQSQQLPHQPPQVSPMYMPDPQHQQPMNMPMPMVPSQQPEASPYISIQSMHPQTTSQSQQRVPPYTLTYTPDTSRASALNTPQGQPMIHQWDGYAQPQHAQQPQHQQQQFQQQIQPQHQQYYQHMDPYQMQMNPQQPYNGAA